MLARKRQPVNDPSLPKEVRKAKALLAERGWSYRAAAPVLGVHYVHLARVLTGKRQSRRLLAKIDDLPRRPEAA